jgi:hypothetical protein
MPKGARDAAVWKHDARYLPFHAYRPRGFLMPQRWREVVTDGIEWHVFRLCPVCKGSGSYPPFDPRAYALDPPEAPCHSCNRGVQVERFRTTEELKRFVNALPDTPADGVGQEPLEAAAPAVR